MRSNFALCLLVLKVIIISMFSGTARPVKQTWNKFSVEETHKKWVDKGSDVLSHMNSVEVPDEWIGIRQVKKCVRVKDSLLQEQEQNNPPDDNPPLVPGYLLLVSEINLDSPGTTRKQFLEVEALENIYLPSHIRGDNLVGYRLLIIAGEGLEIVTSLYLHDYIARVTKNFYTFGTKTTPKVDIDLTGKDVPTVSSSQDSIFPGMDNSPFAVIIIHSSSEVQHEALSLSKSSGKYATISIANDLWRQDMIKKLAIDIVVVARQAPMSGCTFFDSIFPVSKKQNYLLRDWESYGSPLKDISISRCCDDELPFSPECFKLAILTPGQPNACLTSQKFILEENLQVIEGESAPLIQNTVDGCDSMLPNVRQEDYNINRNSLKSALTQLFHTNTDCLVDQLNVNISSLNQREIIHRIAIPELPKKLQFDFNKFAECQSSFTKPDDILQSDAVEWLDFVRRPHECRFYCFMCREFVNVGFRPDIKIRADIVREKGSFSKSKATNSMQIRRHRDHALHKAASKLNNDLKNAHTDSEKKSATEKQLQREREIFMPTMNLIQMAYVELSSGVSFKTHRRFSNVLPELGVNVGEHHRHEKAISDIAELISKRFQYILLESLVLGGKPFTLIVDGTTMYNIPYMVVLIQTLEGEKPVVYLYALIVLTNGEISKSMVNDLIDRVKADDTVYPGFENYFKAGLMVLASDSASNMVGISNSFFTHLRDYLERPIALSKCGAHKLGRILVHALDFVTDNSTDTKYFKNFAHINNLFYTFYMSRGSKRFIELTQKAIELDLSPSRIKYFFDIRFAASQYRCMKTLYSQYDALRLDLLERVSDPTFKEEAQKTAFQLHSHISDKSFAVTVAEFVDFLGVFQQMSRKFQTKGGLMIGNVQIVREGYDKFVQLSNEPGYYLRDFLAKVNCPEKCHTGQCTLSMYDECHEVYTRTGSLESTIPNSVKLSEVRSELYENILIQMKAYFPRKELEPFDLFNPRYFKFCPSDSSKEKAVCDDLDECYIDLPTIYPNESTLSVSDKLQDLCDFYGISKDGCKLVQEQWILTLSSLVMDKDVFDHRNDDVTEFWPRMVQRSDLSFGPAVSSILSKILVTAFTSSDAERLFSFLTRIKSPERFNLKSETMEGLARIQFNGPNVLSKERLFEITREFLKTHVRADDNEVHGGRKPSLEELPNFLATSRIF